MIATIGGAAAPAVFITDSFFVALDLLHQPADRRPWALAYLAATLHLPGRRVEHRVDYLGRAGPGRGHHRDRARLHLGAAASYAWASSQILGLCAPGPGDRRPVHHDRGADGRADPSAARVPQPELLAGHRAQASWPGWPCSARSRFPAAVPAGPCRAPRRPSAGLLLTPMMVGVMITSLIAGPDHHPDGPVQGAADPRRGPGWTHRHVAAVPARGEYQPG